MRGDAREPGELRLHLGLVIAAVVCVSAFAIELWRATSGNALSWAYVGEWPLLLAYAVFMWHRLLNDHRGVVRRVPRASTPDEEAALEAWNAHLAALHAHDAAAKVERGEA
jgi:hypothetical protein